jgi:hypothetical protein
MVYASKSHPTGDKKAFTFPICDASLNKAISVERHRKPTNMLHGTTARPYKEHDIQKGFCYPAKR